MIRIDPMYRTSHLIDFKLVDMCKLIDFKNHGISSVKRLNVAIYIDKPLDYKGRINKKHLLHIVKFRNLVIKGIKEIKKEIRKRNECDV